MAEQSHLTVSVKSHNNDNDLATPKHAHNGMSGGYNGDTGVYW